MDTIKEYERYRKAMARRDEQIKKLAQTMTKAAVARKFNISRERVRQIVSGK